MRLALQWVTCRTSQTLSSHGSSWNFRTVAGRFQTAQCCPSGLLIASVVMVDVFSKRADAGDDAHPTGWLEPNTGRIEPILRSAEVLRLDCAPVALDSGCAAQAAHETHGS